MARVALSKSQKIEAEAKRRTRALKHLLDDKGITQKQVADVLDKSQQEVSYELNHIASFRLVVAIEQLIGELR